MLSRALLSLMAVATAWAPAPALAQGDENPPVATEPATAGEATQGAQECVDGWFCEPTPASSQAAPAKPPPSAAPEPGVADAPTTPTARSEAPPAGRDEPVGNPPPRRSTRQRQGLVGRLSGGLLGQGSSERAPFMLGVGAAFRVRPLPHFAIDGGVDLFAGRDFLGAARREAALSVTTQLYFNPEDAFTVYLPAGLFHTWARVEPIRQERRNYRYMGAFLGVGVEHAFSQHLSGSADLIGFLRGRVDPGAIDEPEYVDLDSGAVTNSSGGGLIRVAAQYYF